jgi:hypothetical protein
MSAFDHLNDRRNKREHFPDVMWDVVTIEQADVLVMDGKFVSGTIDWSKSRHVSKPGKREFYAWIGNKYYVLGSDNWLRAPKLPDIDWGPAATTDQEDEES